MEQQHRGSQGCSTWLRSIRLVTGNVMAVDVHQVAVVDGMVRPYQRATGNLALPDNRFAGSEAYIYQLFMVVGEDVFALY